MTIIGWLVLGLIAGWVASTLMGRGGYGIVGDIILGILGSFVGGWLAALLLGIDVNAGLNLTSIGVAIAGAVVVLAVFRAITGRRTT